MSSERLSVTKRAISQRSGIQLLFPIFRFNWGTSYGWTDGVLNFLLSLWQWDFCSQKIDKKNVTWKGLEMEQVFFDTRITLNKIFSSSVMWQLNILKMWIVLFLRKIFEITWKSINNRQGTTIFSFLPNHTYLRINRMILTRIHFLKEKYRTWQITVRMPNYWSLTQLH